MKRYTVHEYPLRGAFSSSRYVNHQLRSTFPSRNRKGGIIVFPEDLMDIDTSFIKGKSHVDYLISGKYNGVKGATFSDTSLCLDVVDYNSGELMSLAMKYARLYGRPILLKDFEDKRFYNLKFNLASNKERQRQAA